MEKVNVQTTIKNFISNYVPRAYKICSNNEEFNIEIERIKELLMKNSYQKPMISKSN